MSFANIILNLASDKIYSRRDNEFVDGKKAYEFHLL